MQMIVERCRLVPLSIVISMIDRPIWKGDVMDITQVIGIRGIRFAVGSEEDALGVFGLTVGDS